MKQDEKKYAEQNTPQEEPVYGNESFGIPSDCTQKQKMSGFKLTCYIIVVVSLCGLIYGGFRKATERFLPEMTFDKSAQPLLYIRNHDVTIKGSNDRKGKSVVSAERIYSSGEGRSVTVTDDGKYVFFASENTGTESGFDLCYRRISTIDGKQEDTPSETVCIDSDVREYKIHPNGKFVLYLKGNRLYFSDLEKSNIVASDVTEFYLSKNSQQMVYYKTGGAVYTRATAAKSSSVQVDSGIQKVLSEKNEYAKIYYLKNNALYLKEMDKDRVLLAENVLDAIVLDEYVYFVKKEPHIWRLQEVFLDEKQVFDKERTEPYPFDYTAQDATGAVVLDEAEYNAAVAEYEGKVLRDTIREYFKQYPITSEQYVLYTIERGDAKKVDEGLSEYSLRYHSCKQAIVYKKDVLRDEKIKLSTLTGTEDALAQAERYLNEPASIGLGVLRKDKTPYLGLEEFPKGQIEISLDGKYLYCIEQIDENGKGTLVRYDISSRALKNRKEIHTGITDFALDGADSQVAMAYDGAKMGICIGETYTHLSDSSNHEFFYVDGTLYFFDEYNEGAQSGTLKRFRDGKAKVIDYNVHSFDVRNLKTVAYIKNYNTELGFGDLYLKSGNRTKEKIDVCVRNILY